MLDDEQQFVMRGRQGRLRIEDFLEMQIVAIGHPSAEIRLGALGRLNGFRHVTFARMRYSDRSHCLSAITVSIRSAAATTSSRPI